MSSSRTSTFRALALSALGAVLLSVAPAAEAGGENDARSPAQRGAKDERLATRDLWGLKWHADWKAATLANRLAPRDARPIVHLRILGDLAAKT